MTLSVVPLKLSQANGLVALWHRHHQPVVGHRFSLGVVSDDGVLHGACIAGRPIARLAGDPQRVLEVTRLVTDGTQNACSVLYAAAARAGRAMGYERIQTYILQGETGVSLKASGWVSGGFTSGGSWERQGRPRRSDQPMGVKERWGLQLNPPVSDVVLPVGVDLVADTQGVLL